jgi:thiamine kinase-like enzyme
MLPRDLAARALGIEAGAIVSVCSIKHGLTNESWLVRTANDAVVVRTSNRQWASLQIDRIAESLVLDAVAQAGIGPEVVAFDLSRGLLVTRYLGPTCTQPQMHEARFIVRPPHDVREVHLPSVVAGYLGTLDTLSRGSSLTSAEMRNRGLTLATEIAESFSPRLCHNDVHHLNLVDRDPLRLIDWEYAGVGEPFFDLASVCIYHDYSLQQRTQLLQAYAGSTTACDIERLAKCCWLFEYVRDLWIEVRTGIGK